MYLCLTSKARGRNAPRKSSNSTPPWPKAENTTWLLRDRLLWKAGCSFDALQTELRGGASCAVEWPCWRVLENHTKVISTLRDQKGQWGGSSARRCRQNGTTWLSSIPPPAFGDGPRKTKDFPTASLPLAYPIKHRSGCCPRSVQN